MESIIHFNLDPTFNSNGVYNNRVGRSYVSNPDNIDKYEQSFDYRMSLSLQHEYTNDLLKKDQAELVDQSVHLIFISDF